MIRRLQILAVALGVFGFAGCSGGALTGDQLTPSAKMSNEKIDPSLSMAIENSKSGQPPDREVDVLIRTKNEINTAQRAAMERNGARIGSVMGDILTARVPAGAVSEIAKLEFVVYIEMSKKQRLR